ncbi:hypothetical protein KFE25_007985 [Diacronema lutheri]|uniref:Macro domain-containing protein n=1 Tax=Diacronema lutheri TaxID=2081491 RepID=A0A8J5XMG3_DIALT|nr:hypothetical protein KFE25_007985 [Diacronema lutheri]
MAASSFKSHGRTIRVVVSRCVVMAPPNGFCDVLINPANERLVGTKLPYFPRGGPVPEERVSGAAAVQRDWVPPGFVSKWGGMEIGSDMMYSVQVVDGMVGMLGGDALRKECRRLPIRGPRGSDVRCPQGEAVRTSAPGGLAKLFGGIVHTVPPFYKRADTGGPCPEWRALLERCWLRALDAASPGPVVAAPLLGAGARGAPVGAASHVAARAAASWLTLSSSAAMGIRELHIAVQTADAAHLLAGEIDAEVSRMACAADAADARQTSAPSVRDVFP